MNRIQVALVLILSILTLQNASAEHDGHRLGLGVGIAQIGDSSHSYISVNGEYEYRLDALLGLGTSFNYVFSSPNFVLLALPEAYLHPLGGDWYINMAPLFQFGGGLDSHLGARLGTRLPITLGAMSIIPQVNVDFINGGRNLLFGLGISI